MKRDLERLNREVFDLVIIGGGIYGACLAWEGARRQLRVALLEKSDFGGATSANSLKVIHGGLRYLQHADLRRARRSIRERRLLMELAPHLVHPMPVLVPAYGHGWQGREVYAAGMLLNDLVSFDRNRLSDPQKHIPNGRILSRRAALERAPHIRRDGLSGGILFHDAQVYNSERLTLAFLEGAVAAGAEAANHAAATGFIRQGDRVSGVLARDQLTGDDFAVKGRMVLNAAGPWHGRVQSWLNADAHPAQEQPRFAKAFNLVTRPLFPETAVGVSSPKRFQDKDALINKGSRLLFVAPWRERALVGTEYIPHNGDPGEWTITEAEVAAFLQDVNRALQKPLLTRDDVSLVQAGLLPIDGVDAATGSVQLTKHYHLHDHQAEGIEGLMTVVGVKYTTARAVAETIVAALFRRRGQTPPPAAPATLPGGEIDRFDDFLQRVLAERPYHLDKATLRRLVMNYGTRYTAVLDYLPGPNPAAADVWLAETRYAVQHEMARRLSDVVLRRTEMGTAAPPPADLLHACARQMAADLGWSSARLADELSQLNRHYPKPISEEVQANDRNLARPSL